jgi:glutamate-1-semialdehyde 2,1-aminomutase
MLAEGVAVPPGAYEALFVGATHTDEVLEQVGAAATRAAASVASRLARATASVR